MSKTFLTPQNLNNLDSTVLINHYIIMERNSNLDIIPSKEFKYERYENIELAYNALRLYGKPNVNYLVTEFISVYGYKST